MTQSILKDHVQAECSRGKYWSCHENSDHTRGPQGLLLCRIWDKTCLDVFLTWRKSLINRETTHYLIQFLGRKIQDNAISVFIWGLLLHNIKREKKEWAYTVPHVLWGYLRGIQLVYTTRLKNNSSFLYPREEENCLSGVLFATKM